MKVKIISENKNSPETILIRNFMVWQGIEHTTEYIGFLSLLKLTDGDRTTIVEIDSIQITGFIALFNYFESEGLFRS